jgi:hypothetical protein
VNIPKDDKAAMKALASSKVVHVTFPHKISGSPVVMH